MTLRRLALACTMALLAAVLMTLPPALAASPGAAVPLAHAAQDDGTVDGTDDGTDDGTTDPSADDVPTSCDDASGSAGAGSDEAAGDTTAGPTVSFRSHGADDPAGDDSQGGDGGPDVTTSTDDGSVDDGTGDDGAVNDSGDDSLCDEPVDGVFDFATTEATLDGASSRTIRTGHAVFREDGTVWREVDFRTGNALATTSKRKHGSRNGSGKGKRRIVLAVVQRKVRAGEQVSLDPRLTSTGRKVLKRAKGKTLKTTVKTTFRPVHGKPRTYTTTLLLHR